MGAVSAPEGPDAVGDRPERDRHRAGAAEPSPVSADDRLDTGDHASRGLGVGLRVVDGGACLGAVRGRRRSSGCQRGHRGIRRWSWLLLRRRAGDNGSSRIGGSRCREQPVGRFSGRKARRAQLAAERAARSRRGRRRLLHGARVSRLGPRRDASAVRARPAQPRPAIEAGVRWLGLHQRLGSHPRRRRSAGAFRPHQAVDVHHALRGRRQERPAWPRRRAPGDRRPRRARPQGEGTSPDYLSRTTSRITITTSAMPASAVVVPPHAPRIPARALGYPGTSRPSACALARRAASTGNSITSPYAAWRNRTKTASG